MQRDCLHVGALMMPRRVQRFAGSFRFQKIFSFFLIDLRITDAQQEALGVFEVNKVLQKIEQQHVDLVVRQFDLPRIVRLDGAEIVNHHVHRGVGRLAEQFRQIAAGRFKRDVRGADVFEVLIGHEENDE